MDTFESLIAGSGLLGHALFAKLAERPPSQAQLATVLHQFAVIDVVSRRLHSLPGQLGHLELADESRVFQELSIQLNERETREAFPFLADTVLRSYAGLDTLPKYEAMEDQRINLSANAFLTDRFGGAKTENLPETLNLAYRFTDRRDEGLENMARALGGAIVFERVLQSLVIPAFVQAYVESGNYGRLHIDEPGLLYLREGGCRHDALTTFMTLRSEPLFALSLRPAKAGAELMCKDIRAWWDGLLFHLF